MASCGTVRRAWPAACARPGSRVVIASPCACPTARTGCSASGGSSSRLIPVLELGGTVFVLPNALDLEGFLGTVEGERVNLLVSVPAIYHALIAHPKFAETDTSGVRWLAYGGAPIAESLVARIKDA